METSNSKIPAKLAPHLPAGAPVEYVNSNTLMIPRKGTSAPGSALPTSSTAKPLFAPPEESFTKTPLSLARPDIH